MGSRIKLKEISSKVFTLSYARYRFFIFLMILILLKILPFSLIQKTHNFSICSKVFGKYCFSVGITRGVSLLLKGNFKEAINYNFLSVLVLGILLVFLVYDFYKGFIKRKI